MPRSELVCDGPALDPLPAPDFCISASGLARSASRHPRHQRLGIGYRQHLCARHSAWRLEAKCLARWKSVSTHTYAASADTPGIHICGFTSRQALLPVMSWALVDNRKNRGDDVFVLLHIRYPLKGMQQCYIQLDHARHFLHYLDCSQQLLRPPQAI